MSLLDIKGLVTPGRYRHFKGNEYKVLFCARNSEDLSVMVIYVDIEGKHTWARPIEEFNKPLPDGGLRFTPIN